MRVPFRYRQCALIPTLMRSRYLRLFTSAATFFLMLSGTCVGQNTTHISLDQAIDLALTHNHSIQATRTLILQNQAQEITANLPPQSDFRSRCAVRSNLQSAEFFHGLSQRESAVRHRDRISLRTRSQAAAAPAGRSRSNRCHSRPGRRRRTDSGFQRGPAVRQCFVGGINPSVRASGPEKFSADRRYQRSPAEGRIHWGRRLSQD